MLKTDYVTRSIHEMIKAILKLLFRMDTTDPRELEDERLRTYYEELIRLAGAGKINEAENRLYEMTEEEKDGLKLSLLFYDAINTFDEEFLEDADFSREEIVSGIQDAARRYGCADLSEALLKI